MAPVIELGIAKYNYTRNNKSNHFTSNMGILINTKNSYIGLNTSLMTDRGLYKTNIQLGNTVALNQHLKLSIDGQYIREHTATTEGVDSHLENTTRNVLTEAYLVSLGLKYKGIKFPVGAYYNKGQSTEPGLKKIKYESSIKPMIGLGYYGNRFSVQGNLIFNQLYKSNADLPNLKYYSTGFTSEVVLNYTFNGKKDKK